MDIQDVETLLLPKVSLPMKYLIMSFLEDGSSYCNGSQNDQDMIKYTASMLTYNTSKQPAAPAIKRIRVWRIDSTTYDLTLFHDIEV